MYYTIKKCQRERKHQIINVEQNLQLILTKFSEKEKLNETLIKVG